METLLLYQVDAFTDRLFGGNPAAVVPLPTFLPDELLQNIARENNLSETAYVVPAGEGDFHLRWFTPTREVRLCGHATLAAAHVLFAAAGGELDTLRFRTRSAGTLVVRRKGKRRYTLDLPADRPRRAKAPRYLAHALGLDPHNVLRGQDDLLVILDKAKQVRKLNPDLGLLAKIKKRGVIVTAPGRGETDFVSRCFYPRYGIAEDPVTGSAHTLLVPYWAERLGRKKLRAAQLSERGGELECRMKGDRVLLTGAAVTYLTGEIRLKKKRIIR